MSVIWRSEDAARGRRRPRDPWPKADRMRVPITEVQGLARRRVLTQLLPSCAIPWSARAAGQGTGSIRPKSTCAGRSRVLALPRLQASVVSRYTVTRTRGLGNGTCNRGPGVCSRAPIITATCLIDANRQFVSRYPRRRMVRGSGGHFPEPDMLRVTVLALEPMASVADRAPFAVGLNE